jgi:site-specific DNA-methyltransferase (adenine-specific)
MGTGTTAKAAHIYKRNWIGSEISQEYIDLANKRLEPYLTQQTLF